MPTAETTYTSPPSSTAPADSPPVSRSLRRRLVAHGSWAAGGRLLGIALAVSLNMLLARLLPATDFGRFAIIISVITCCSIVARFGLDRVGLRLISEYRASDNPSAVNGVVIRTFKVAAVSCPLVALAAVWGMWLVGDPLGAAPTSGLWPLIALGIVLHGSLLIIAELLRGYDRVDLATLFDGQLAGPLLNLSVLALVAATSLYRPVTLDAAVLLYCLGLALVLAAAGVSLRGMFHAGSRTEPRTLPRGEDPQGLHIVRRPWLTMCLSITLSALLSFACYQADLWIAALFCSPTDVSLFAAARRLVQITSLPLATLNMAVISSIPALYRTSQTAELQSTLRTTATAATAVALPAALLMILVPLPLLRWTFGPEYMAAAPVLMVLVFGQFFVCWTGTCTHTLILTGNHTPALMVHLVTTALLCTLGPVAAARYGITGLAAASAAVLAANNVGMLILARVYAGVWTHAFLRFPMGRRPQARHSQAA